MNDETPETGRFEAERRALLDALLDHVPFDGWTGTAMAAAAEQAGLDAEFPHRAFPRGAVDAIEYFNRVADTDMAAALAEEDLEAMRVRDRIARAVRVRLEQNAGHRDAVRRGLTVLSFPPNGPVGMRILYRTVDAIWRAAGDSATDFNFYTKRGLLAGVYSATVVYWLNDGSEDFSRTWRFLDRRIDETMQIPKALQRLRETAERLPDPLGLRNFLRQAQPGNFRR
ncbi:MAG: COQ9 family protein [Rhodospirillaceae bacterium]|nr:COQ9 family protein [Rhodospirillaceae bacterium]